MSANTEKDKGIMFVAFVLTVPIIIWIGSLFYHFIVEHSSLDAPWFMLPSAFTLIALAPFVWAGICSTIEWFEKRSDGDGKRDE